MLADNSNADLHPYFPKFRIMECVLYRIDCNPHRYVLLDFHGDMLTCHLFCLSRALSVALRVCIPNAPPITLSIGDDGDYTVR